MLSFLETKNDCTGCMACYSICPQGCISMIQDSEGFYYPSANKSLCINCNLCQKVCPQLNIISGQVDTIQTAYAVKSKDELIWRTSSSGGAFTEICKLFDDGNTFFYGAAFEGFDVNHICVKGIDNIKALRRSKYVQSYIGDTFKEIRGRLNRNENVVFSGAPCQVAGLRSFLGKKYDNLFLIDFICHGVGSPYVFKDCIDLISKDINNKITKYEFRVKVRTFRERFISEVNFGNSEKKILRQDRYIQLFLSQRCIRPVCVSKCLYRNQKRQGDITLADFKGIDKEFSFLKGTKYNYTAVVFNTVKSFGIKDKLVETSDTYESCIDRIKEDNPLFYRQTNTDSFIRDDFFDSYTSIGNDAISKYTNQSIEYKLGLKQKVFDFLPFFLRHIIKIGDKGE